MFRSLVFALFLPFGALAQSTVPADVHSVASGGYWEADGESGIYRVVVVNSGFEHVTSQVFVEWVRGPKSGETAPVVVVSLEPALPFGRSVASVDVSLRPIGKGEVRIAVDGVISVLPNTRVRAVLVATQPGHVAAMTANRSLNPGTHQPVPLRGLCCVPISSDVALK